MKYKRYIWFVIEDYYPSGGLHDIVGSFETLDDARAAAIEKLRARRFGSAIHEIVDRDTWTVVESLDRRSVEPFSQ